MFKRAKKEWPVGSQNLYFKRTTSRYGRKGTFAHNPGYMRVKRNATTGQFAKV